MFKLIRNMLIIRLLASHIGEIKHLIILSSILFASNYFFSEVINAVSHNQRSIWVISKLCVSALLLVAIILNVLRVISGIKAAILKWDVVLSYKEKAYKQGKVPKKLSSRGEKIRQRLIKRKEL